MGGTSYSVDDYAQRASLRAATNTPTFAYSNKTASQPKSMQKAHDSLNPVVFGANGKLVRESRDSQQHPNSLAIAVPFDVTGSMGSVPITTQKKLNTLMGILLKKGYAEDPQIMVAAVGDSYTDSVPLQIAQFESGIEIDDHLNNVFLEGNGGGQKSESYSLILYYLWKYTSIDCLEKRNKKGYIFLIGDEKSHDLPKDHILKYIGVKEERDYSFKEILFNVQKKYNVFFILPKMTSYYDDPEINKFWKDALGENFLKIEDADDICELIASTIGLCEGNVEINQLPEDLINQGISSNTMHNVIKSLSIIKQTAQISKNRLEGTGLIKF